MHIASIIFFDFFVSETSIVKKQVIFWNSYNFSGSIQDKMDEQTTQ